MSATEQALRDRVEQLESALGQGRDLSGKLRDVFGLEPAHAQMLGVLYKREFVSREGMYTLLYGARRENQMPASKSLDAQLCRLRKRLEDQGHHITIDTRWGEGWSMKQSEKAKIAAQLGIDRAVVPIAARRMAFLAGQ